ncbi:glycosyl hydrolase [Streptomyces sp. NBC_01465]|uniref:glycosyl hydrolase n=1 Tax=Streptomyces sp. NBC_01465 TaxID=2903878 RepID=UPI002E3015A7|nr:glycosyl hydrolase [Streptomyces sp. NBC_01465]
MEGIPQSIATVLALPPRAFSPTAIWWWSGERLDRARLRDQLQRFVQGGVFNLVLLNLAPSGPLFGSDADDPPFMSDAWWVLLDGVCEDAEELGVSLWFYDQLGFSGADLQARLVDDSPAFAGRRLERVRTVVEDGGALRCPAEGQALAGHAEPVDAKDRRRGPSVQVAVEGGEIRAPGPGRWRLTLHHHTALGFDYLGRAACAALLDQVHGAFERRLGHRLGTVVVGSFQDELPSLPTWSAGFAEAFAARRGYELTPHLDALYADSTRPDTARIRHDYHLTRAELAEEAFFQPLAAWHEGHGLTVGCDQQDPARAGHPVAGVQLYADYARTHRWFSAPGSDHHGDARIHSSLAHLYGRPRTWIEAFHSTGWGGTLEETYDWLLPWLRAGATLYNPHAVYYTTKGGWWEWAPPGTDWRQPYWAHHRVFADAVTRLCAVLSLGSHVCDIAVLLPTATAQAGTALDGVSGDAERAQDTYLDLVGDMTWFRTRPGVLDRAGLDADVVDDASLVRARVDSTGGEVRLRVADEAYAAVVLPACTVLEQDTARRLVEFAAAGGHVVAVGELPRTVLGAEGALVLGELRACFDDGRAVFVRTADDLAEALDRTPPVVSASVPALVRRVEGATVVFLTAASPRATQASVAAPDARGAALGWLDARYDFDPGRYARTARLEVRGTRGSAVLLDPFGGPPRVLPVRDGAVEVPFDAGPAALVVFPVQPLPEAHEVASATELAAEIAADAAWEMALVPTLDNTWGDFARPVTGPPGSAAVLERHAFRDGEKAPVHATFGPRAVLVDRAGEVRSVLEWSDSRGIHKDPVHRAVLGPKGHVPEEFLHIGPTAAGAVARVRTELLVADPFDGALMVGAGAAKTVRLDGVVVDLDDGGHLALGAVRLEAGRHLLELDLVPDQDIDLRGHVALVRDAERCRRPEWIVGDRVGTAVALTALPARAVVQVASFGPCVLRVNGEVVGRQGGFDPYADHAVPRVRRHEVAGALRIGDNAISVETGDPRGVLVDAVFHGPDGGRLGALHSDGHWRDGAGARVAVRREPAGDPAALHLWRRPHPLPGAAWLDPEAVDGTVVPVVFAAPGTRPSGQWMECQLPPGTGQLSVRTHGDTAVFVEGRQRAATTVPGPGGVSTVTVDLSGDGPTGPRSAALRIAARPGREGGAALAGPLRCTVGAGRIRTGDWEDQGLAGYSGGVRYSRVVEVARGQRCVRLALGRVRGTAEVRVGGVAAGVRVCSPYDFDVSGLFRPGPNLVEITVYGTLAPHLDDTSPTHFVFPGQRVTGLMGPVRLYAAPE